jgi:hypothetical protein
MILQSLLVSYEPFIMNFHMNGMENASGEPSSSKSKIKGKPSPSPDEECSHCHKKDISSETIRTWGSKRRREGINVTEINIAVSSSDSWVFATKRNTCKSLQGLSLTRRFANGELDVCVSIGAKVATIAVGTFHLPLPLGLVLELNNC